MSQDLEKFGMPEEELFAPVDHSDLESEKITAPRYSYWHSVFRVFFKKKINIIILSIIADCLRVIVTEKQIFILCIYRCKINCPVSGLCDPIKSVV